MKIIENLLVKIKKLHPDAVIPAYAHLTDGGADITCVSFENKLDTHGYIEYHTGLAFEIPEGYVGLLFARSSVTNKDLLLGNCVGILDSSFRGQVTFRFRANGDKIYNIKEKIGQIIVLPRPQVEYVEVDELSDTARGSGGYGSTGV